MKLYQIAHSRTGDKGNISTISVIAYNQEDYPLLCEQLTEDKVISWFAKIGATRVKRYEVPSLGALNFVLENTLGGGVTRSLSLDKHGKSLSGLMLEMDLG
ncbi:AtuA-related protein [Neobacillus vireti]|uniref:AtuA-related protein n=1 Tax=Neobacillus vireti TaxID=220686 RepID=UPI002FFDA1F9